MERLGRFIVGDELGQGPYSAVYEARHEDEPCALRVFQEDSLPEAEDARAGFIAALRGLAGLEHPSIVKILDAGEEDGRPFVAMEMMTAPTLREKLDQEGALEEKQVILFVRQAAQAVDKARDVGYFHGDLGPHNVFVVSDEKIKIGDFAFKDLVEEPELLPRFAETGEPEEGATEETEWVTAEELLRAKGQASGQLKLDEDFTGLAVLALEMLDVEVPQRGEQSLEDYRSALLRGPVAELGGADSGVSVQTSEVLRRLLTPGGFDSAGEVVVELASAMLLRRPFARKEAAGGSAPFTAETATVSGEAEEQGPAAPSVGLEDTDALKFQGDPRTAAFTPFFVWASRRGGRFFLLHEGERLTIGRDPDYADVALMDPAISRRHCVLSREGDAVRIEDLGSTNGTFLNEARIEGAEVEPGDSVRIGATKMFMSLTDREG